MSTAVISTAIFTCPGRAGPGRISFPLYTHVPAPYSRIIASRTLPVFIPALPHSRILPTALKTAHYDTNNTCTRRTCKQPASPAQTYYMVVQNVL